MRIGVIGINYKQASLADREEIAKLCQWQFESQRIIHPTLSYVLLSTCHRTEIYFQGDVCAYAHSYLLSILRQGFWSSPKPHLGIEQRVYSLFGSDCFHHLVRVTAGLESAFIGETEIQGQVKRAYESACARLLPSELHFLFQKALKLAKEMRATMAPSCASLAQCIENHATSILGGLEHVRTLFIGVSCINQRIAAHFSRKRMGSITYCNRTLDKARALPFPFVSWEERERWVEFDIVIVGVRSPHDVIADVPHTPQHKVVLIDLSVPRTVSPYVGHHPSIALVNIDELVQLTPPHDASPIDEGTITQAVKRQIALFTLKQLRHRPAHSCVR